MANKMLIDATHPEETRVVVVRGNRVEEFDYESASRKQLRGNIYLAKVTRVEPSLQAAFIEYGGNRHGFLAFSEIHPDYYQIPVADRQALIEEEERAARAADEEADQRDRRRERGRSRKAAPDASVSEAVEEAEVIGAAAPEAGESAAPVADDAVAGSVADEAAAGSDLEDPASEAAALPAPEAQPSAFAADDEAARRLSAPDGERDPAPILGDLSDDAHFDDAHFDEAHPDDGHPDDGHSDHDPRPQDAAHHAAEDDEDEDDGDLEQIEEDDEIENLGADEDALEEVPERAPQRRMRSYKIQEVIRRRQVMLVQVVKEERGNKGAALTTYLSLAGRYSVLMPNTARGGGISRKITNATDRKRLKDVVQDLEVPEGMGIILRTAGANRTKTEIKRDFEYLLRLWETVRELTLSSSAPSLVYEEGSLIKRAIRDLYNKDIDDIQVAGEAGFKEARDFMRMLMPSHARNVVPYRETQPIFARYGVEQQLDAMFSPVVQLKSGGYIVINPTEALVSIDVNSGRATREHHIEDTALKTNVEAAEEIARQLRLRDLAGLIVIDFIDMEEKRNNRSVERKLKDCLKNDRARIQIGRISHFGLLEMSRQRIRTGVLESSIEVCPHCGGTGHVRSAASVALQLIRALEEQLLRSATHNLLARTRTEVALYVLNQKRAHLRELEERFSVTLLISADDEVTGHQPFLIDKADLAVPPAPAPRVGTVIQPDSILPDEDYPEEEAEEADADAEAGEERSEDAAEDRGEDGGRRRRRRRRRKPGERDRPRDGDDDEAAGDADEGDLAADADAGLAPRADQERAAGEQADDEAADDERSDEERADDEAGDDNGDRRRRRRGRRGGRRNRREREGDEDVDGVAAAEPDAPVTAAEDAPVVAAPVAAAPVDVEEVAGEPAAAEALPAPVAPPAEEPAPAKPRRRSTVREKVSFAAPAPTADADAPVAAPAVSAEAASDEVAAPAATASEAAPAEAVEPEAPENPADPEGSDPSGQKPRSGWWQRKLFGG